MNFSVISRNPRRLGIQLGDSDYHHRDKYAEYDYDVGYVTGKLVAVHRIAELPAGGRNMSAATSQDTLPSLRNAFAIVITISPVSASM